MRTNRSVTIVVTLAAALVAGSTALSSSAWSQPTTSSDQPTTVTSAPSVPDSATSSAPPISTSHSPTTTTSPPTGDAATTSVAPTAVTDGLAPLPVPSVVDEPGWTPVEVSQELSDFVTVALRSTQQLPTTLPVDVSDAAATSAADAASARLAQYFSGEVLERQRENLGTSARAAAAGEVDQSSGELVVRSVDGATSDGSTTRLTLSIYVSSTITVEGDGGSRSQSTNAVDKSVTVDVNRDEAGSLKVVKLVYETPALPTASE